VKTTQTIITLAVLTLTPGIAMASGGCNWMKTEQTAMSCAEGTSLDAATNTCVPLTIS
jgi:hypothetical protein